MSQAYQTYVGKRVIALFARDHIRYQISGNLESHTDGEFKFVSARVHEEHPRNGTNCGELKTFPNDKQVYDSVSFERHQLVTMAEEPR